MLSTVVLSNENQTCRGREAPTSIGGRGCHIGDGALIGHNAVLATINHMEDPEKRAGMIFQPIRIEKNVWLGANERCSGE